MCRLAVLGGVGFGGFLLGLVAGYLYAAHEFENAEYEEELDFKEIKKIKEIKSLTKIVKQYDGFTDEEHAEEEEIYGIEELAEEEEIYGIEELAEEGSEEGNDDIFLITPDFYYQDDTEFEKVSIIYYQIDGVFCDDDKKLSDDQIKKLFGDLNFLDILLADTVVYIRNLGVETDFFITSIRAAYDKPRTDEEKAKRRARQPKTKKTNESAE